MPQTVVVAGAGRGVGLIVFRAYLRKFGAHMLERLQLAPAPASLVDYRTYR